MGGRGGFMIVKGEKFKGGERAKKKQKRGREIKKV